MDPIRNGNDAKTGPAYKAVTSLPRQQQQTSKASPDGARTRRHHCCGLAVGEDVLQEGMGNNKTLMTWYEFMYKTGCTVAKIAVR